MKIDGLSFLGDTFLNGKIESEVFFEEFVLNLEFAITDSSDAALNKINLKSDKVYFEEIFGKNPVAVNLANNHVFDFEEKGFENTIQSLEEKGIMYFGAGNAANNFNNPAFINYNSLKIGLLGYCCASTNPNYNKKRNSNVSLLEIGRIEDDIKLCKDKGVDYLVVNIHWGVEEVSYPKPNDVILAKQIIDKGADLIIGHHAHVIQSRLKYKDKHIFFGLGNFIFPNLEVNAYHDGEIFTRLYKKKQALKNRRSVIVTLSKNLSINSIISFFDDNAVKILKNFKIPRWIPKSEKSFKLYLLVLYRKNLIVRFIQNPKIPQMKHLKAFISKSYKS